MNMQKQKRQRGIILTSEGLQKLQEARLELELKENFGERYTLEQLSECTGLDIHTIKRVLSCQQGVDKRTLERIFIAFNLDLSESCHSSSILNKRIDWGEAICVSTFYGRTEELAALGQWLLQERCRLVALVGMGGIGKTALSIKLAEQVQDKFEYVIWRSLRDAPPVKALLANLIQFLSDEQETEANLPESVGDTISRLIYYLRKQRCLLVLDNGESLLSSGSRAGQYRQGYEGYGELIRRVGEANHRSCLVLTTREKPKEVASLEGEGLPVRSLQLRGLKEAPGQEILKIKGLSGSEDEFRMLVERYVGNALALKVVATTIKDLFDGKICEFLQQETAVFGDIRDLLEQQFERLSDLEKDILYWLAINREPVKLSELREDIVSPVPPQNLLEALESLLRRSLIEKAMPTLVEKSAATFTLQPVVMEYLTNRLIEQVCGEIETQKIDLFRCHALMKATAKDYVRETQVRLILKPVMDGLLTVFKSKRNLVNQLTQLLATLREKSPLEQSYTAGNVLNLLCHLKTDLSGYDFSHLSVWQADLRKVNLHNVNFKNANLTKSVFSETFGGVMSVAFSPDGELLAAGDSNGEIHLWRIADSQQFLIFRGHTNWVVSLAFGPDSRTLASGSSDCTVRLWDVGTGQCLHTLGKHGNEVWSVAFSPNGDRLASACDDHMVRLWVVSTGECLKIFQGHTNWVTSVAFSLDGQTLVSGSDDNTIRLWDINSGECLKIFHGHSDGIRSISLSYHGQMLASSSDDQTIRLWNLSTGECLKILQGHSNQIFSVAFSPQGDILASGSHDRTVRLWDVSTGECKKIFQEHSNWVCSVAFSPEGDVLASGSRDQTVRLWHIRSSQCLKTFQGHTNQVLSVAFNPDGNILASGGHNQKVRLWDVRIGQTLKTLEGHTNWVYSVAFNRQGDTLVSGSGDKTVKLWDVSTGQCLRTCQGHTAAVWSVALSHDGRMLASGSEDQTIRLWDIRTGQCLRTCQGHTAAVWSVAFSPQETVLASGSLDQTVKLWDANTGECLRTLEGHTSWAWAVAFSPDGDLLASTSADLTLRLWSVRTGECKRILQVDTGWLLSVAFSPDNQTLATSSQDHTVKLWDVSTGESFKTLPGHSAWLWSVAFSPDNQTLVSGGEDETIRVWNIRTGECLKTLEAEKPYERLNLTGVTGITEATRATLKALGAVD